jgi:hypothetical protein
MPIDAIGVEFYAHNFPARRARICCLLRKMSGSSAASGAARATGRALEGVFIPKARMRRQKHSSRTGRKRMSLDLEVYAAARLGQTPSRRAKTGRDVNPRQILRPWHGRICALLPRPEPRKHCCQTLGSEAHKPKALLICCSPVIQ